MRGERRYRGFSKTIRERSDLRAGEARSHQLEGFTFHTNGGEITADIDGVRVKPGETIVKSPDGRTVARFDDEGGITYDAKAAAPLFAAFPELEDNADD